VVYLLADENDQPVQLLCVRNLRSSLKRRLSGAETIGPSKRVNYRDLVRRIYWRRVESAFEADWIYYEAARQVFPESYQGMVGFRPAWFVHVNPDAPFPRYAKTIDLTAPTGALLGPLEDKHAAARLIELVEDAFDLCRYYHILLQSPKGKACAYKEMGKCPAPCDGSISMEHYRAMITWSLRVLVDPADFVREQTARMQAAASELRFETAAKIKTLIDQMTGLRKGPFRHVRRLQDFQFLSLQRGPRERTAKVFLITPGDIVEIGGLIDTTSDIEELVSLSKTLAAAATSPVPSQAAERIGIVAHHLFLARQTSGVFLPLDQVDVLSLQKAFADLQKQKGKDGGDEEGLLKELQAM